MDNNNRNIILLFNLFFLLILIVLVACQADEISSDVQTEVVEETNTSTLTLSPSPTCTITLIPKPTKTPTPTETLSPIHVTTSIDDTLSLENIYDQYGYGQPEKGIYDISEPDYSKILYFGRIVSYDLNYNNFETTLYVLFVSARGVVKAKIDYIGYRLGPFIKFDVKNASEIDINEIILQLDFYIQKINQEGGFPEYLDETTEFYLWYGSYPLDRGDVYCEGLEECPFDPSLGIPSHEFMYNKFTQLIIPSKYLSTSQILSKQDYPIFSSDEDNTFIILFFP